MYTFEQDQESGRWVTRFDKERIGSANTKGQAVATAIWHQKQVFEKFVNNDGQLENGWLVIVRADSRLVSIFRCESPEAAIKAAKSMKLIRTLKGLKTGRITMEQILRGRGKNREYGPAQEIDC